MTTYISVLALSACVALTLSVLQLRISANVGQTSRRNLWAISLVGAITCATIAYAFNLVDPISAAMLGFAGSVFLVAYLNHAFRSDWALGAVVGIAIGFGSQALESSALLLLSALLAGALTGGLIQFAKASRRVKGFGDAST